MKDLLDDIQRKLMELTPEQDARYTIVKKGKKGPQVKRYFTDQKKVLDAVREDVPENGEDDEKDRIHVASQDHDLEDMPDVISPDADLADDDNVAADHPRPDADADDAELMELVGDIEDDHFGDSDDLEEDVPENGHRQEEAFLLDEDAPGHEGVAPGPEDVQLDDRGFDIPDRPFSSKSIGKPDIDRIQQDEINVLELEEAMNQFSGAASQVKDGPGIHRPDRTAATGPSPEKDENEDEDDDDDDAFDLEEPTPIDPDMPPGVKPGIRKRDTTVSASPGADAPAEINFAETLILKPKPRPSDPSSVPLKSSSPKPAEPERSAKRRPAPRSTAADTGPQTERRKKSIAPGYIAAGFGILAVLGLSAWWFLPLETRQPTPPWMTDAIVDVAPAPPPPVTRPVEIEKPPPVPDIGRPLPAGPGARPEPTPSPDAPMKPTEAKPVAVAKPEAPPPASREQQLIDEITGVVEGWRVAWENSATASGDMDAYQVYYSNDFASRGMDKAAFIQDKVVKNRVKQYIRVNVENLEIYQPEEKDQIIATFFQHYDSSNYTASGPKTLTFQKEGNRWKIVQEVSVKPPPGYKRIETPPVATKPAAPKPATPKPATPKPAPSKRTEPPAPAVTPAPRTPDTAVAAVDARRPAPTEPETKTGTTQPVEARHEPGARLVVPAESGSLPFTIHAGSFQEYRRAFEAATSLIQQGLPAFLAKVNIPHRGDFFRLHIGSYADQSDAQREVAAIRKTADIEESLIVFRLYAVRIGHFPSKESAANRFDDLLAKGLTTYALRDASDPERIRLMVGAFEHMEDARKIAVELETAGFATTVEER